MPMKVIIYIDEELGVSAAGCNSNATIKELEFANKIRNSLSTLVNEVFPNKTKSQFHYDKANNKN